MAPVPVPPAIGLPFSIAIPDGSIVYTLPAASVSDPDAGVMDATVEETLLPDDPLPFVLLPDPEDPPPPVLTPDDPLPSVLLLADVPLPLVVLTLEPPSDTDPSWS